jgi:hypothetical protein
MAKKAEVQEDGSALAARAHLALRGANSHTASPAKVGTFKDALRAVVKAGALSECRFKTPIGAARDFALESMKSTAGPAVPLIWEEQADEMRDRLGYETAPPIEGMMIEHIILCWLRLATAELQFSAVESHGGTLKQIEHHQRKVGAAQRRFTRGIESLARVRKLSLSSVQINVAAKGGQQVNVAG